MSIGEENQQVLHASESNFRRLVLESDAPVLVDFYADWCGPCQRMAPVLQSLAAELPEVKIVKVDVDRSPGLAAEYGVDSIPNLKAFRNGRITGELVGLASKSQLRAMLGR